ncbi:MAG: site-specific integrase, partial [Chloroflexi bacterium]|nr:site-specific integrase [Chloroflexota bacterium]
QCPTIFVATRGKPWTRENLRAMLYRLGDKAGVPVSPHDFRRGACTDAIRKGMSTITAQRAGGWSSPLMVARYAGALSTDDVRAALERVA